MQLQQRGRQTVDGFANHQFNPIEVMVQPEEQGFRNVTLAAQVKPQTLHAQRRQRLIGMQRKVHGDRRYFT